LLKSLFSLFKLKRCFVEGVVKDKIKCFKVSLLKIK
jgi:hypothetical protein